MPITEEMTRIDNTSRKAKSLARLMAEEAFSSPAPKLASNVPIVRIVGRKLTLATTVQSPPATVHEASNEPAKAPRIFVIRPPAVESAPPQAETSIAPAPLRRRRRAHAPAPAQVIYSAPERAAPPPVSLELLAGSLAGIEPTLDIIRRAMAFEFRDPAIGAEWEQLSRAVNELSEQMAS